MEGEDPIRELCISKIERCAKRKEPPPEDEAMVGATSRIEALESYTKAAREAPKLEDEFRVRRLNSDAKNLVKSARASINGKERTATQASDSFAHGALLHHMLGMEGDFNGLKSIPKEPKKRKLHDNISESGKELNNLLTALESQREESRAHLEEMTTWDQVHRITWNSVRQEYGQMYYDIAMDAIREVVETWKPTHSAEEILERLTRKKGDQKSG